MSKRRYTVEVIAAGQPRPYADTIRHVRVTLEWQGMEGFRNKDAPFVPSENLTEEAIKMLLPGLQAGFTDYIYDPKVDASMDAYFRTRLDWLRQIEPGVWEFHTTSPYDD